MQSQYIADVCWLLSSLLPGVITAAGLHMSPYLGSLNADDDLLGHRVTVAMHGATGTLNSSSDKH